MVLYSSVNAILNLGQGTSRTVIPGLCRYLVIESWQSAERIQAMNFTASTISPKLFDMQEKYEHD